MPAFDATLRSAGTQTLTARDVANAVSGLQAGIVGNARVDSVGRLSAWGYNSSGELGDNSLLRSTEPVAVNTAGVLAGKTVTLASQSARGSMASGSIVMTAKPHGCLIERRLAWARRRFRKHFLAWFGGVTYISDPFRARLSLSLKHSRLRFAGGCVACGGRQS